MDFKAIKEHVKNNSIVDFCNQSGIGLTGNGRYRRLEKHDSCVIDTMRNEFYWNSLGKNGDIINFVQTYYETDFKTAVEIITGKNLQDFKEKFVPTIRYSPPDKSKEEKSPFKMELDETDERYSRLFAYLNKTRKISYKTISEFVEKKLISQDRKGNINFKFTDENGNISYSKKGSTDKSFNYIDSDADIRGFRYIPDDLKPEDIKSIYVFESPIDLMSFADITNIKNKNSVYMAMNGLKHNSVIKNLEDFPNIESIHLCVDNDNAGKNFIQTIRELCRSNEHEILENKSIIDHRPEKSKDWNDFLKYIVSIKEMDQMRKNRSEGYRNKKESDSAALTEQTNKTKEKEYIR